MAHTNNTLENIPRVGSLTDLVKSCMSVKYHLHMYFTDIQDLTILSKRSHTWDIFQWVVGHGPFKMALLCLYCYTLGT